VTPRISPIDVASAPPDVLALLEPPKAKGSNGTNWFATAIRNTGLYAAWRPLAKYLNSSDQLTLRERELIVLRTAWLCQSEYEWGQHVLVARNGGLTDSEIERIRTSPDDEEWTTVERALLRLPAEFAADARVDPATWAELAARYDEAQLLELLLLVGHYFMIAFALSSIDVERESGVPGLDWTPSEDEED